jgi:ketosteroid isomerase-like protein
MTQRLSPLLGLSLCLAVLATNLTTGCASRSTPGSAVAEVRAVLERQVIDWNQGNVAAFLTAYAHEPTTRFASGGDVTLGFEPVRARYERRYSDPAKMGRLGFHDVEVQVVGPDAALVFGRWELQDLPDVPHGLFTLLFRRQADGWRIVHDHTSAATTP